MADLAGGMFVAPPEHLRRAPGPAGYPRPVRTGLGHEATPLAIGGGLLAVAGMIAFLAAILTCWRRTAA